MKLVIYLVILIITLIVLFVLKLKRQAEPLVLDFNKWEFPPSAYPNWYKVVKNGYNIKMADTGITLPSNRFSMTFNYKLTSTNGGHNNLFRITNTNIDCCNEGDRIRSLWINPNDTSFLLVGATNDPNAYTVFPGVPLNTVVLITLLFDNNRFSMYVNKSITYSYVFDNLRPIPPNSTLYIGDKFYPANGEINIQDFTLYDGILNPGQITKIHTESFERPLIYNKWVFPLSSYPNWYKTIQNGYNIKISNTGLSLGNKFSMSFIYKLTGLNPTWNNIVHITNSGGDDNRCPGIWVRPNETNLHLHYIPSDIPIFSATPLNTQAFFTFVFNNNSIEFYINGVKSSFNYNNGGILTTVLPTATMYFGNPFHGSNGTINIQDFTLYEDVLSPQQIIKMYKELTPRPVTLYKWVFPNSVYPTWYNNVKNGYTIKMAKTGITLPSNQYSISFMYKLIATHPSWTNVFLITNTNSADGGFGGRNPSLWITPGDTKFHLRFTTSDGNSNNGFDAVDNVPLNTVAFVTFVFNINTVTIYIDGVNITSNTFNGINSILPNATLYIASPNDPTGHVQTQDFTFYDGALTQQQITQIYDDSTPEGRAKIIEQKKAEENIAAKAAEKAAIDASIVASQEAAKKAAVAAAEYNNNK